MEKIVLRTFVDFTLDSLLSPATSAVFVSLSCVLFSGGATYSTTEKTGKADFSLTSASSFFIRSVMFCCNSRILKTIRGPMEKIVLRTFVDFTSGSLLSSATSAVFVSLPRVLSSGDMT